MKSFFKEQLIPLALTVAAFFILCALLAGYIHILNLLPSNGKIHLQLRLTDILVGLTIYIKTSIDFAIFIGNLMHSNPGWHKRIAINLGTATGNGVGTMLILTIWNFFREVPLLMAVMIILASLVLLRMAEESFETLLEKKIPVKLRQLLHRLQTLLRIPNKAAAPLLRFISPNASFMNMKPLSFFQLLTFSATIPFILGLDDFAGYIPLFNIVNVYGFATGVFLGHMLLNSALYISPKKTTTIVRSPWVLVIGGSAFILIALWGFYEVIHLIIHLFY